MIEHYNIPIDGSGLTANITELEAGGNMLIITGGSENRTFESHRAWIQAEVFEFNETMTLEQIMDKKEREMKLTK